MICSNCAAQVADIIDTMGIASAKAQDLQHAITSADKLRISDHLVYLMIDPGDNKWVKIIDHWLLQPICSVGLCRYIFETILIDYNIGTRFCMILQHHCLEKKKLHWKQFLTLLPINTLFRGKQIFLLLRLKAYTVGPY